MAVSLTFHIDGNCSRTGPELVHGSAIIDASKAPGDLLLFFQITMRHTFFAASHGWLGVPLSHAPECLPCSLDPRMVAGANRVVHFWHICKAQREHTH